MNFPAFARTKWLANLWRPIADQAVLQVRNLEEVFEAVYAPDYEQLCLVDHQAAEVLPSSERHYVEACAKAAFKAAWARTENHEFAALVSDDVHTIASLLRLRITEPLAAFTEGRLYWLLRGHFVSGYRGRFPGGTWIVA